MTDAGAFEDVVARRPAVHGWRAWYRALGWSSTSVPVAFLLLSGIAIGPHGINLLTLGTLSQLDPVIPVALATLGVLVGLGLADRRPGDGRVIVAATVDAAATMLIVSAGVWLLVRAEIPALREPWWLAAGICAATFLTLPTGDPLEPRPLTARIAELGVLLPVVAGALLLAWLRAGAAAGAVLLVAQSAGLTLVLAAAGWLLLTRVPPETESRVYSVSALLLVGGASAALSLSALFGGLAAGLFWRYAGRHPREAIRRDVLLVQHPLLVLVLLMAGARAELTPAALGVGVAYLLLRVAGRLAGGFIVGWFAGPAAFRDPGLALLSPGVFGVAFALNAVSAAGAAGTDAAALLGAVVTGSIGAEVVALVLGQRKAGA